MCQRCSGPGLKRAAPKEDAKQRQLGDSRITAFPCVIVDKDSGRSAAVTCKLREDAKHRLCLGRLLAHHVHRGVDAPPAQKGGDVLRVAVSGDNVGRVQGGEGSEHESGD